MSGDRTAVFLKTIILIVTVVVLMGCRTGAIDGQGGSMDAYQRLALSYKFSGKTYEYERLAASLETNVLWLSPTLAAAAGARWADDPVFNKNLNNWGRQAGTRRNAVYMLVGIYAPDFKAEDFAKAGRFRAALKNGGDETPGRVVFTYGRQSKFINDYFPVFNPWEQVFVVVFNQDKALPGTAKSDFVLKWPKGEQVIPIEGNP